jgi:hypothetical protein
MAPDRIFRTHNLFSIGFQYRRVKAGGYYSNSVVVMCRLLLERDEGRLTLYLNNM